MLQAKVAVRTCLTLLIAGSLLKQVGCGDADELRAFDEPARACAASGDCGPNEECSGGRCVRYASCSRGQACAAGQQCLTGICRFTCSAEEQCQALGLNCLSGHCVPLESDADASGSGGSGGGGGSGGVAGNGGGGGEVGASGASNGGTGAGGGAPDVGSQRDLIDDLEDGDKAIVNVAGRQGSWYVFNDGRGTQTPPLGGFTAFAGGAESSQYATHTWGDGFSDWGAGIGVDLNNPGDRPQDSRRSVYDVRSWQGISFRAKGTGRIRFMVLTRAVVDAADQGSCQPQPDRPCFDAHGVRIQLSADWAEHRVRFSELAQEGWGVAAGFDAAQVLGVSFQHPEGADVSNKAAPFDFWIDDLGLFRD